MTKTSPTLYYKIDNNNYPFPPGTDREDIEFALNYSPKNNDKILVTYPKCGTTWTQQIILLILNDGIPQKNDRQCMKGSFIEFKGKSVKPMGDNVIKTHLPFNLMPYNKSTKYLAVFRNPKDQCVSFYYHVKGFSDYNYFEDFHDFFKYWIKGEVESGDYFDHILSHWTHRFDENYSFLVYEHMKYNTRDAVLKVAQFMGEEYVRKVTDNNGFILDKVIESSTIETMKSSEQFDVLVRKGIVGDWRSHFTKDESDLVDQKVKLYFSGTGLENLWTEEMKW